MLTMATPLHAKSSVEAIRARFDADVDRFANLQTGQQAVMDAPLMMTLLARAAAAVTPNARRLLDVGCGAGNNTLMTLGFLPGLACDLLDLSAPMLARAQQRVSAVTQGTVRVLQGDMRDVPLEENAYDVVLAAAVLHHLRDSADWEHVLRRLYAVVAPGGALWISDMVAHDVDAVQALMWARYGDYLTSLGGDFYRRRVFDYIDWEDSPRSVTFQLDMLRRVGFAHVELLHKNSCFAAFGAVKAAG